MKIFSANRKKIEPHRRFGGLEFRSKVRDAAGYKRVYTKPKISWKFWRNLAIVIALGIIYILTLSNYFVVSEISVSGNEQISTQSIIDALKAKNIRLFFLTEGKANQILTSAFPSIKKISSLHRSWPDKVSLNVVERNPGFVISSNSQYFLIDDEGVVVSSITAAEAKNLLVVVDSLVEDFAAGEALPNTKISPFVLGMNKQWGTKINTPIRLVKFSGKASSDIQFETTEGWSAFFDATRPVVSQLSDLALILNKKIPDRSKLVYIDLRSAKFVYYCFKASACEQQPQTDVSGAQTDIINK